MSRGPGETQRRIIEVLRAHPEGMGQARLCAFAFADEFAATNASRTLASLERRGHIERWLQQDEAASQLGDRDDKPHDHSGAVRAHAYPSAFSSYARSSAGHRPRDEAGTQPPEPRVDEIEG